MKFPIYLDYSATTPVDPRVVDKMIPFLMRISATLPARATNTAGKLKKPLKMPALKSQH